GGGVKLHEITCGEQLQPGDRDAHRAAHGSRGAKGEVKVRHVKRDASSAQEIADADAGAGVPGECAETETIRANCEIAYAGLAHSAELRRSYRGAFAAYQRLAGGVGGFIVELNAGGGEGEGFADVHHQIGCGQRKIVGAAGTANREGASQASLTGVCVVDGGAKTAIGEERGGGRRQTNRAAPDAAG